MVDTLVHGPSPFPLSMAEQITPQQRLQLDAHQLGDPAVVSPHEKRAAAQLAHLASQHHASEYNRLKFGLRGAPMTYIPLSIQLPSHINELRTQQALSAQKQAWWPASVESKEDEVANDAFQPIVLPTLPLFKKEVPPLSPPHSETLQHALSQAMTSPLTQYPAVPSHVQHAHHTTKTSETHPINVSLIIPFELLPIISSHLTPCKHPYPTIFSLPPNLHLDRLTTPPPAQRNPTRVNANGTVVPAPNGISEPAAPPRFLNQHGTGIGLFMEPRMPPVYLPISGVPPPAPLPPPPAPTVSVTALAAEIVPNGHVMPDPSLSSLLSVPVTTVEHVHPTPPPSENVPSVEAVPVPSMTDDAITSAIATAMAEEPMPLNPTALFHSNEPSSVIIPAAIPLPASPAPTAAAEFADSFPPLLEPTKKIGNLFLSSCPGKKVRLSGPVKGRAAICRDLGRDLLRMKELGVGCIVCCLDDDELEFLGAPWLQYSREASALGIDVLRLPTPEGLAPLTPHALNTHLDFLINTYTRREIPILVHCRGGVGRAGLVACCWMLKVGLCGWIAPSTSTWDGEIRRETIELVEKVVSVVRRRRSVKAIETYEQVRFLVDFVEYLSREDRL